MNSFQEKVKSLRERHEHLIKKQMSQKNSETEFI